MEGKKVGTTRTFAEPTSFSFNKRVGPINEPEDILTDQYDELKWYNLFRLDFLPSDILNELLVLQRYHHGWEK